MNDLQGTPEYKAGAGIVERLRGAGFAAYFVGGAVRAAIGQTVELVFRK